MGIGYCYFFRFKDDQEVDTICVPGGFFAKVSISHRWPWATFLASRWNLLKCWPWCVIKLGLAIDKQILLFLPNLFLRMRTISFNCTSVKVSHHHSLHFSSWICIKYFTIESTWVCVGETYLHENDLLVAQWRFVASFLWRLVTMFRWVALVMGHNDVS